MFGCSELIIPPRDLAYLVGGVVTFKVVLFWGEGVTVIGRSTGPGGQGLGTRLNLTYDVNKC